MKSFTSSIRKPTLIEILLIVAIVAVLLGLLLPETQWVADGTIEVPVRVLVFDAGSALPIEHAEVAIFRCGPWLDDEFLKEFREDWTPGMLDDVENPVRAISDAKGEAIITYRFNTSCSNKNPTPRAATSLRWVAVRAPGHGGATVQLRATSTPTAELRANQGLKLAVGLLKPTASVKEEPRE